MFLLLLLMFLLERECWERKRPCNPRGVGERYLTGSRVIHEDLGDADPYEELFGLDTRHPPHAVLLHERRHLRFVRDGASDGGEAVLLLVPLLEWCGCNPSPRCFPAGASLSGEESRLGGDVTFACTMLRPRRSQLLRGGALFLREGNNNVWKYI